MPYSWVTFTSSPAVSLSVSEMEIKFPCHICVGSCPSVSWANGFNGPFAITSKVIIISVEMSSAASGKEIIISRWCGSVSDSGGLQRTNESEKLTRSPDI